MAAPTAGEEEAFEGVAEAFGSGEVGRIEQDGELTGALAHQFFGGWLGE